MNDNQTKSYKKSYSYIFSSFYLVQGLHNGIWGTVLAFYLIINIIRLDEALLFMVTAMTALPWSLKFFIGMINDKYQISEKFGRRFPFICIFGTFGGVWWIIMGLYLPLEVSMVYLILMIYGILINIGLAIADTALDGLILDVTPKGMLGRVQGWTFGMLVFGHMAGGYIIGISFIILSLPIPWLFMIEGLLMIIVCFTPYFIEEELISSEKFYVWKKVKDIVRKKVNWKVFTFSIIDRIDGIIIGTFYGLLVWMSLGLIKLEGTTVTYLLSDQGLELYLVSFFFSILSVIGILLASFIGGKLADKNRRHAIYFGHLVYIPWLFFSIFLIGIVGAIIGYITFAFSNTLINVANQTIRGDMSKKDPETKATYYAITISAANFGMMLGALIGGLIFIILVLYGANFTLIYFIVAIICVGVQLLSFWVFMTIDPAEYEFEHHLKKSN
ncbi:MAG: MFS transporter [Promethearchaeota archaeon]